MKTKKFIAMLTACLLSISCLAFCGCDDEKDTQNNSNTTNDYDNLYDDREWTDNH